MCISSALYNSINTDVENHLRDSSLDEHTRVALDSLRTSIIKKFEDTSEKADLSAIAKFLEVNERMGNYQLPSFTWSHSAHALMHADLKYSLWKLLGGTQRIMPYEVLDNLKVGPGASVGVRGGSLFEKLTSGGLTSTDPRLTQLFFAANERFDYILSCENIRMQNFGHPSVVDCSTLSCVPKNREISRTICTEPLINMLFQQGLKSALSKRLRSAYGIDLEVQQAKNRRLAQLGSIDGSYATIDLSSASDSLSTTMIKHYFPKECVDWLMVTRSGFTRLPNGERVKLNMISSMGNAFTFPLQTILFAAVVLTVYRYLGIEVLFPRGRLLGNFAVNGDDIIIKTEAYPLVVSFLTELGFEVNTQKSFSTGFFRESCGGDYYRGHSVRGVYARKLDSVQDIYSLINRLNFWSEEHKLCLPNTISWLLSLIKDKSLRALYVPMESSDTDGIKAPSWFAQPRSVVDNKTGAHTFLYKRFKARVTELVIPMKDYSLPAYSQILFGGAASKYDGSSELVTVMVRPLGPIKYKLVTETSPRWDWRKLTSTTPPDVRAGLRGEWIYLVSNLGEG